MIRVSGDVWQKEHIELALILILCKVSIGPKNSMNYPVLQPNKIIPFDSVETNFVNDTAIIVTQGYFKYFIPLILQF